MKKALLSLLMVLFVSIVYSQTCTPSFTVSQNAPYNNQLLRVQISSTTPSTTHVRNYEVHWGDGQVSNTLHYPTTLHNYATTGTYTIKVILTLIDSTQSTVFCKDSATQNISLTLSPCATSVSANVNTQNNGQVTFTANTPANTPNMTYIWQYGDGTTDTTTNATISHTYSHSGGFQVKLIATNGNCTYTNNYFVNVLNGCGQANFTAYTNLGLNVSFISSSSFLLNYPQYNYWIFGDGSTSATNGPPSINHLYSGPGTYNVTLVTTWVDSANQYSVYCKDTITKSITVTGSSIISGYIYTDTSIISQPAFKVWLITYDSSTQILSAVDSLLLPSNNLGWTQYTFTNVPSDTYRVKAAITNGPTSGTGYVPTYHDSDLLWNNANIISHVTGNTTYRNILMQHGTVTSGPGFVGGDVTQGANKGTANGIPDMPVYIVDMNDQLLSYSTTDGSGNFSFSNIPTGTYRIYPEQLGYTTTPATVIITNTNSSFNNIYFERSHTNKTITPIPVSIKNVNSISGLVALYPNPASKEVSIKWDGNESANIILSDVTGKQIMTDITIANSIKRLDISKLNNGLYFVTIESKGQKLTQKLLIQ